MMAVAAATLIVFATTATFIAVAAATLVAQMVEHVLYLLVGGVAVLQH